MKTTSGTYYGHDHLIEKIVVVIYLCGSTCGRMKEAYACASAANTDNDCILFDISCNEQEHIFIKEASYGFRKDQPQGCKTSAAECRLKDGPNKGCCTDAGGDQHKQFEVDHKYNIFKACSWKHQCSKQTPVGNLEGEFSKYSFLDYECQTDLQIVRFCEQEQASGKTVDLILDGGEHLINNSLSNSHSTECKCILETNGTDKYQISAPDLRLQSESHGCNSDTVISGLAITNITCNTSFTSIRPSGYISSTDPNYHPITVSFKFLPEFIWIKVKGKGKDVYVHVRCFGRPASNDTTPVSVTTTLSTTETNVSSITVKANDTTSSPVISDSAVSNTTAILQTTVSEANISSTSASSVSATQPKSSSAKNNTTVDPSSTTAPDPTTNNQSKALEVYSPDSNEAPVAAIVIPVILVLVGTGVCLLLWRKWRRRKDKLAEPSEEDNNKEDTTAANKRNDYNYHNTSDCTVQGIGNPYAYIDHGDTQSKPPAENQMGNDTENTYTYIDQADMHKQGTAEGEITDPTENNYAYIDNEKVINSMPPTEEAVGVTCTTENTFPYIDLQDVQSEAVTTTTDSSYHILMPHIGSGSSETDNDSKLCKVGMNETNASKQTHLMCDNHTYSALDIKELPQCDDKVGLLQVQQNRQMTNKPKISNAVDIEGHDYFKTEPKDNLRAQTESRVDNINTHDKETDESHNYFLLEPQNTNSSVCPTDVDSRNCHEKEIINNHNYFVLEPHDTTSSNNANNVNTIDVHTTEVTKNHDYFVLEPQDNNVRNNERVGGIQTLPENEYNVLSLKPERICHDPNYGTLETGQPGNIENDTADYSHLDTTPVRKHFAPEYSHVKVDKT